MSLWRLVGLVSAGVFLSTSIGEACGDKLLSAGRGARFQRWFLAKRPASILIYASRNGIAPALKAPEFQAVLKKVGHRVETVDEPSSLSRVLLEGKYDLVVADFSDAGLVLQHLRSAPARPTLLPVVYKPSKQQAAAVAKEYGLLLRAPGDILQHLDVIDDAMKAREAQARAS
jgi:hypothetical protein